MWECKRKNKKIETRKNKKRAFELALLVFNAL